MVISTTAGYRATYDLNGNQTVRVTGTVTYTQQWDPENHLTVATNTVSGVVTRLVYDGDGRRVLQTVGTATTVSLGDTYEKNLATGGVTTYCTPWRATLTPISTGELPTTPVCHVT